jgi:hypothetical protein
MWIPASRKRRWLAYYIDLMLFGAVWHLIDYGLRMLFPAYREMPLWGQILILTVLENIAPPKWSPGVNLLSMRQEGEALVVDRAIWEHENWLTVLMAVALINDGAKAMFRWTLWTPPIPVFGAPTNEFTSGVLFLAFGLAEIYGANGIFKLRAWGAQMLLVVEGMALLSILQSWDLWDAWMELYVQRRHAFYGRAMRPEMIQAARLMVPEFFVAGMAVLLALLAVVWFRLRKLEARQPSTPWDP